ncbi:MAG TPA: carbohydrate porin, partial [Silvibacterium sp.]|nr:carbohydrate porin [Silvibacterium sp.]
TKNEHFYFWEGGVSGLARTGIPVQARGPMDANNIHLTGWYRNPTNGTPQSYGVAFNANRMIGSQYMWFVRSGWSVGHFNNWALSGGLGWRPAKTTADLFGAAFGWTRPTVPVPGGLRSQYTAETFYRFHVTPNFAITPDFQLIQHPALNPRVDTMWVTSVRARVFSDLRISLFSPRAIQGAVRFPFRLRPFSPNICGPRPRRSCQRPYRGR